MAVTSDRITVTAAAVALNAAETDVVSGSRLCVTNRHATESVDLGPAAVAAGAGYELRPAQTLQIDVPRGEQLFAIRSGVADVPVHVLRVGV